MVRVVLAVAFLALVGACGATQSSVQVKGPTEDVVLLAGDWQGEYRGIESGRQGTIKFSLAVGRHTADGYVKMFPEGAKGAPRALKIQFVQVDHGQVTGRIDAYTDPSCNCQVETVFSGSVEGDVIDGMFETKVVGSEESHRGQWSVYRYDS